MWWIALALVAWIVLSVPLGVLFGTAVHMHMHHQDPRDLARRS